MGGFSGGSGGGLSASGIAGLNSGTPDGNSIVPFVAVTPAVEASARVMHFTFGVNPSTDDELPAISGITGLVLKEAAGEYDFPNIAVIAGDLAATLGALADQLELHKTDEGYESLANYSYTADGSTLIITAITTGVNTDTFGASTGNVTVSEATPGADASPETYTLKQSVGGLVSGDLPTATVINPDTDTIVAVQEVMRVTGLGAGDYTYRGTANGKRFYDKLGEPTNNPETAEGFSGLFWSGGWAITDADGLTLNSSPTDTVTPDLATWTDSTVTAVPVTMQVSREVLTGFQSAVLTADFEKTDDTLTAVTDLTLNLEAGKTYRITGRLDIEGSSTGLAQCSMGGGTATYIAGRGHCTNYSNSTAAFDLQSFDTPSEPLAFNNDGVNWAEIDVICQVDAGGTLIVQFAQGVTDATASTLRKYSTITAQRLD